MKIQDFINNREKYQVDSTYQRAPNAWTPQDKQCLIDTILRGEPMPVFFLNYVDGIYFIVDGQQRLDCISQFYDNKIKLNAKFSGKENAGRTFGGDSPISDALKQDFLDYDIKLHVVENYDDDRVRLIFSRLQRGKPLSLGERLNAMPGRVVDSMRLLADHPFMSKSIAIPKQRYGLFPDVARFLFYAKYGAKDAGSESLYTFFEKECDLDKNTSEFKEIVSTLNHLAQCFPPMPGNYRYLEKHAWVLAVFTMIHSLRKKYSLYGEHGKIGAFIQEFHSKVYAEKFRSSNRNYQRFFDRVRGGWSEKLIDARRDILIEELLLRCKLPRLDEKRQISDNEKIAVFATQSTCTQCGAGFKDYKAPEYHHVIRHAAGGQSVPENIMVVCKDCHRSLS